MNEPIEVYNQLMHDADEILDGMPLDLMRAAMDGSQQGADPFLVALDADDIDDEIRTYASGGDISSLTARQRWSLAARMRLAAGVLHPFRREGDGKDNAFQKALSGMSRGRLIEFLLIDIAPSLKAVLSEYLNFAEEWHAPNRLPWKQSLARRFG